MASAALETYKATRKAMYLVLARMHDMGMNPDIEKAQANEILSVNTLMLGQAFIGNAPKLKMKNPLENGCNITTFFDTIQSFLSEYQMRLVAIQMTDDALFAINDLSLSLLVVEQHSIHEKI